MKKNSSSFCFHFNALSYSSCSKSGNSNVLVGSWMQTRVIERYTDPFTQATVIDTVMSSSATVQFKNDGSFFLNGIASGTYTLVNETTLTLNNGNPPPMNYTFQISGNTLKTERPGAAGEQIRIWNPDDSGEFKMANLELVSTEYVRQ